MHRPSLEDLPPLEIEEVQVAAVPDQSPRLLSMSKWRDVDYPPLSYVIDSFAPQADVANVVAPQREGKTWLTSMMAVAVAAGEPFLGRFAVKQGPVILVTAETHSCQVRDRIMKRTAAGIKRSLWNLPIHVLPREDALRTGFSLATETGDTTEHSEWLRREAEKLKPRLIVLDNLSSTTSFDLLNKQAVVRFYRALQQLAVDLDLCVIVTTHTKKGFTDKVFSDRAPVPIWDYIYGDAALAQQAAVNVMLKREESVEEAHLSGFLRSQDRFGRVLPPTKWRIDIDPSEGKVVGRVLGTGTPGDAKDSRVTELILEAFEWKRVEEFGSVNQLVEAVQELGRSKGQDVGQKVIRRVKDHLVADGVLEESPGRNGQPTTVRKVRQP